MGPAGKEFVYKKELRSIRAQVRERVAAGTSPGRSRREPRRRAGGGGGRGGRLAQGRRGSPVLSLRTRAHEPGEALTSARYRVSSCRPNSDTRSARRSPSYAALHPWTLPGRPARIPLVKIEEAVVSNTYTDNPLIHAERRRNLSSSAWVRASREDLKPLIVCRGPIRRTSMSSPRWG